MKTILHVKGNTKPNLLGRITLAIGRGYTRVAIPVLVARNEFCAIYFWERGGKNNSSESDEGPQNIPVDSFKTEHQKTAHHSLDSKVGRGLANNTSALTCMASASGISISSSVAMILSPRSNNIEWDVVLANASALKKYQEYGQRKKSRAKKIQSMDGFESF